jgi:uncharacterized protein YhaN
MCQEAGCDTPAELADAEKRSSRRLDIESRLRQIEERLVLLGGGKTVDDFTLEIQTIDPDAIEPQTKRRMDEIEALEARRSGLDQTIGREKNELSKMDGSARAADLEEQAQGILAGIASDAVEYARLHLASEVLKGAIAVYRDRHQGPVLERSSGLFARMTNGAFRGLQLDTGDKGEPLLVGVRSGTDEMVDVGAMSDGTVDQLYLAVRLASLDTYLEHNESMPLILDDMLINFDDERAAAALAVLSGLAGRTQIIFFTHHRHLVELAKHHADQDRLIVHRLGNVE